MRGDAGETAKLAHYGGRRLLALAFAAIVLQVGTLRAASARRVPLLDLSGEIPRQRELGGVYEPVLAFDSTGGQATIGGADTIIPESRQLETTLALPRGWSSDRLTVTSLVVVDGKPRWQLPALRRTTPPVAVFEFPPQEVGKPVRLLVSGVVAPTPGQRRRTLGPVAVAAGSRLRLAIGVPPAECRFLVPTILKVDAVEGRRGRAVLHHVLDPTAICDAWFPIDVPLEGVAGPEVRFRFQMRARRPLPAEIVSPTLIADPILEPPASATRPPNVILISLDTLGAKHLGLYGYPYPTSPRLDALAHDATVFDHVVAQYPSTAASHMSLFTSRLVATHGVRGYFNALSPTIATLPQVLRGAGYSTAAFTEDATLARSMGFGRGFHHYRENRSPTKWGTKGQVRKTLGDARRWLATSRGEPFFLFVHTYQVHTPYRPPPSHAAAVRPGASPSGMWDEPVQLYDGEVHYLDERLARFLRYLRTRRFLDDTIVVITADHGESFGEHGHYAHGHCLHEEVMHVPLLVLGPGIAAGQRVPARVGLVDLAPTILELAGAPPLPNADGRSLAPALRGEALAPRPLFAELEGPLGPIHGKATPNQRTVWVGDYKAIFDLERGAWWFTDIVHDPDETRASRPPLAVLAVMKKHLAWYDALVPVTGQAIVGEGGLTPDGVEKLRALGYVE